MFQAPWNRTGLMGLRGALVLLSFDTNPPDATAFLKDPLQVPASVEQRSFCGQKVTFYNYGDVALPAVTPAMALEEKKIPTSDSGFYGELAKGAPIEGESGYSRLLRQNQLLYGLKEGLPPVAKTLVDQERSLESQAADALGEMQEGFAFGKDQSSADQALAYQQVAAGQLKFLDLLSCELSREAAPEEPFHSAPATAALTTQESRNLELLSSLLVASSKGDISRSAPAAEPKKAPPPAAPSAVTGALSPEVVAALSAKAQTISDPTEPTAPSLIESDRIPASQKPAEFDQPALVWEGDWTVGLFGRVHAKYEEKLRKGVFARPKVDPGLGDLSPSNPWD